MAALTSSHTQICCRTPFRSSPCSRKCVLVVRARQPSRQHEQQQQQQQGLSRRQALAAAGLLAAATGSLIGQPQSAMAFLDVPDGFKAQVDRLDGYSFIFPENWLAVTSSGNDIFLRNPANVDQNLFVDISSPSSSRFKAVSDLGSPAEAADRLLDQYLNKEFMSTRIGVRREAQVLAASSRQGPDGREYYDIDVRMSSYASRSPYVATQGEIMSDYGLEWDRRLLTTLGVANQRLYELRLQTGYSSYEDDRPQLDLVRSSFRVKEVEAT